MPVEAPGVGDEEAAGSVELVGFADSVAGATEDEVLGAAATSDDESPRPKISHLSANSVAIIATKTRARRSQ